MELAFRNESWHGAGVPFEQPVIQFMELLVRKSDETLTNSPYVYLVGNAKKCAQRHMLAPNNVFLENGHGERVTAIFLQMEFVNHGANGQHLKCSVDPSKTPIDILSPIRWDGTGGFAALNDVLIRLQAHVTQVHWITPRPYGFASCVGRCDERRSWQLNAQASAVALLGSGQTLS